MAQAPTNINKIQDPNGAGLQGFNAVVEGAAGKINASAQEINNLLANYDPSDPGSLLKTQQALATYNLSISVTAAMIKSLEETTKGVAQRL